MPLPALVKLPEPVIASPWVRLSERLKASVPLLVIAPPSEPLVPPLPICKVPPEIVVPPCELAPVRTTVPEPLLTSEPLPPSSPAYVPSVVWLKTTEALLVIAPCKDVVSPESSPALTTVPPE